MLSQHTLWLTYNYGTLWLLVGYVTYRCTLRNIYLRLDEQLPANVRRREIAECVLLWPYVALMVLYVKLRHDYVLRKVNKAVQKRRR